MYCLSETLTTGEYRERMFDSLMDARWACAESMVGSERVFLSDGTKQLVAYVRGVSFLVWNESTGMMEAA